jgi:protein SCO1/2
LAIQAQPAGVKPPVLKDIGIDQLLNNEVPGNLSFTDETGKAVQLSDYYGTNKPILLSLVYYDCPQLCNQVLNGVTGALKTLPMTPGQEFTFLTVSFDHRESTELAAAKRGEYLKRLGKERAAEGWHFLTGSEESIKLLTRNVGFRFLWDPAKKQYAHASGVMILTPQGRVSRYLYGIEYAPRDLRLALLDASSGKIGTLADQIIMYCYQYDPTTGLYSMRLMNVLRIFGVMTLATLVTLFAFLKYKERQKAAAWARTAPHSS